ncbi:tol-pal system YbgF family protein [Roseivirga sp. E12]|uniref:tetratricopeptide repeat protein n=1 Tax=Roseivirga sp. E12 TaxID=2819237 RepID=UPI001ABC857F|nr:tetratricopeptide repeat protein [Roseivirga sp. E12]MBO3700490.1 tetratricopeptide repeat protein [Roseivirga sp. E12]
MLFTFLTASGQHSGRNPLLNLEFEKTRTATANSDLPMDLYYANLADILELILEESESRFKELKSNESIRLKALDRLENSSPWVPFVQAEIKLQWAFVNFKYGNEWDAFWGLRSAYRSAKKNNTKYPNFEPNKRTLGLLNIIFGNVPSKNQWLMNLFGLRGDVLTGLTQLASIGDQYPELVTESKLILGMTNAYLLEDFGKAVAFISDDIPDNLPLFQYVKSLVYSKAHKSIFARDLLLKSVKRFPIHNYLIAETYFQAGEYQIAIDHYQKFLGSFNGKSYIKDTYLKLSISYGLTGELEAYKECLNKSRTEGDNYSEVDKNAAKIAKTLDSQNPTSLRIRFAIDGGYYQEADSLITILDKKKDLSEYEKLELTYRKARLNHLQSKSQDAQKYYREVIDNAELIEETYYGPNSFLQLGYIMRDEGDIDSAKMYFNEVLSFRKHPYKSSLDSKAKIALKRLDQQDD